MYNNISSINSICNIYVVYIYIYIVLYIVVYIINILLYINIYFMYRKNKIKK